MPIDGDGIDPMKLDAPLWLKQSLQKLDIDGDGIDQDEVNEMMDTLRAMKAAANANSADLDYTKFPQKVQDVLKVWDGDESGSVSVSELALAAESQKKMMKEIKFMKQMLFGACIVIVILTALAFAMGFAANETAKDFRPASADETRRRLTRYSSTYFGDFVAEENTISDSMMRRILGEGVGASPEDTKAAKGTITTSDGTRVGTAKAGAKVDGGAMPDTMMRMAPTEAKKVKTISLPGSTGMFEFEPLDVKVEKKKDKGINKKTFTDKDGVKVVFSETDIAGVHEINVHMEYPGPKGKPMYYAVDPDHLAGGRRRMQESFDSWGNSTCAYAECDAGEPGMWQEHAPEDVPPDSYMSDPAPWDYALNANATADNFMMDADGMHDAFPTQAPADVDMFRDYLDCNGDAMISREEMNGGGQCFESFFNATHEHNPQKKKMMDNGISEAKADKLLNHEHHYHGEYVHVDVFVDKMCNETVPLMCGDDMGKNAVRDMARASSGDGSGWLTPTDFTAAVQSVMPTEQNTQKKKKEKKGAGVAPAPKVLAVGQTYAASPADLMMTSEMEHADKDIIFAEMDHDHNGYVMDYEADPAYGQAGAQMAYDEGCGIGCDPAGMGPDQYSSMMEGMAGDTSFEFIFTMQDANGDLHVDEYELGATDYWGETFNGEMATSIRLLRETFVDAPRRRMSDKRDARRERRLRASHKRKLGSGGEYHSWMEKRRLRAKPVEEAKKRKLKGLQEDIDRRRRLEVEAWEKENPGRRLDAAAEAAMTAEWITTLNTNYADVPDYMIEEMVNTEVSFEHAEAMTKQLDDIMGIANTGCYMRKRILLSDTDAGDHWSHGFGTKNAIAIHEVKHARNTAACAGPEDKKKADKGMKLMKALYKAPPAHRKSCMDNMHNSMPDTDAAAAVMAQTGGAILSPAHQCNTDGKTLGEMKGPMGDAHRRMRFLRQSETLRVRRLDEKKGADAAADAEPTRRELTARSLGTMPDATNNLVLTGKEISCFMEKTLGVTDKDQMKKKMVGINTMQTEQAAKVEKRIRRFLRENEVYDEIEGRRLMGDWGTVDEYDYEQDMFMSECDMLYMADPMDYEMRLGNYWMYDAWMDGVPHWCMIEEPHWEDTSYTYGVEPWHEPYPVADEMILYMDSVPQDAAGNFHVHMNATSKVSFAQFARKTMDDPNAPWECAMLPYEEKILPMNETSKEFDFSNNYWANLYAWEMGPGCSNECSCYDESWNYICSWEHSTQCACLDYKAMCHQIIIDMYIEKGGAIEQMDDWDYSTTRRKLQASNKKTGSKNRKKQKRKNFAKSVHKRRLERKDVLKLLKHQARPANKERRLEGDRKRALRAHYRRLLDKEFPTKDHATGEEFTGRKLEETKQNRRRALQTYNATEHFTADTWAMEHQCGDSPEDICPCNAATDSNCIGGLTLPVYAQHSKDEGTTSPAEACHPAGDMTDMKDQMRHAARRRMRRRLARLPSKTPEFSKEMHRKLLTEEETWDNESIDMCYSYDPPAYEYLSDNMQDEFYDMYSEPTMVDESWYSDYESTLTLHYFPADLSEAHWELNSSLKPFLNSYEANSPSFVDELWDMVPPEIMYENPMTDAIPPEAMDMYVSSCDDPMMPTKPERCEMAREFQMDMVFQESDGPEAGCGGAMGGSSMDNPEAAAADPPIRPPIKPEDLAPAEESFFDMAAGPDGEVSRGQYVCVAATMDGMSVEQATQKYDELTSGESMSMMDATMPSMTETLKKKGKGKKGKTEKKKEKKKANEKKKKKRKVEKKLKNQERGMDFMDGLVREGQWEVRRRLLGELREVEQEERRLMVNGLKDLEKSALESRPRRLRELSSSKEGVHRKLAELMTDEVSYGEMHDYMGSMNMECGHMDYMYEMAYEMYDDAQYIYNQTETFLESGHTNFTANETLYHPMEEVYDFQQEMMDRAEEVYGFIETHMNTANATLETDKGSGTAFAGGYTRPTETFTSGEAEKVADLWYDYMHNMPDEPVASNEDQITFQDFMGHEEMCAPDRSMEDVQDEWYSMTAESGYPVDHDCVSSEAFDHAAGPMDLGSQMMYYDMSHHDEGMMIGMYSRKRKLFALPDLRIDWPKLNARRQLGAKDVISAMHEDPDGNLVKKAKGTPWLNENDAKLASTSCLPWQPSMQESAAGLAEAMTSGADKGKFVKNTVAGLVKSAAQSAHAAKPMTKEAEAASTKKLKNIIGAIAGQCEDGEKCDDNRAQTGKLQDDDYLKIASKMDHNGDGCIEVPLPETYSCDGFGPSEMGMIEDDNNDGTADGGVLYPLDYHKLCVEAKNKQINEKKAQTMLKNHAKKKATVAAVAAGRRRLAMVEAEGKTVNPHLRKLMGKPVEFLDNQGRRLEWFEDEAPMTYAATETAVDALFSNSGANIETYDDMMDMMYMPMDGDNKEILNDMIDAYDEEQKMVEEDMYADETKCQGHLEEMDDWEMAELGDMISWMAPDDAECKNPTMPQYTAAYSAAGDGNSNGYPDATELAHCVQKHLIGEANDDVMHKVNDLAHGQSTMAETFGHVHHDMTNSTRKAEVATASMTVDSKCYQECAWNEVPGCKDDTGSACAYSAACSGNANFEGMTTCDFLQEHGSPIYLLDAMHAAGDARRRLAINKRRVLLEEEKTRRLEAAGGVNLDKCMTVNGKEFCRELNENERRLQEEYPGFSAKLTPFQEELFLNGIEYLVPAATNAAAPRRVSAAPSSGARKLGAGSNSRKLKRGRSLRAGKVTGKFHRMGANGTTRAKRNSAWTLKKRRQLKRKGH